MIGDSLYNYSELGLIKRYVQLQLNRTGLHEGPGFHVFPKASFVLEFI